MKFLSAILGLLITSLTVSADVDFDDSENPALMASFETLCNTFQATRKTQEADYQRYLTLIQKEQQEPVSRQLKALEEFEKSQGMTVSGLFLNVISQETKALNASQVEIGEVINDRFQTLQKVVQKTVSCNIDDKQISSPWMTSAYSTECLQNNKIRNLNEKLLKSSTSIFKRINYDIAHGSKGVLTFNRIDGSFDVKLPHPNPKLRLVVHPELVRTIPVASVTASVGQSLSSFSFEIRVRIKLFRIEDQVWNVLFDVVKQYETKQIWNNSYRVALKPALTFQEFLESIKRIGPEFSIEDCDRLTREKEMLLQNSRQNSQSTRNTHQAGPKK